VFILLFIYVYYYIMVDNEDEIDLSYINQVESTDVIETKARATLNPFASTATPENKVFKKVLNEISRNRLSYTPKTPSPNKPTTTTTTTAAPTTTAPSLLSKATAQNNKFQSINVDEEDSSNSNSRSSRIPNTTTTATPTANNIQTRSSTGGNKDNITTLSRKCRNPNIYDGFKTKITSGDLTLATQKEQSSIDMCAFFKQSDGAQCILKCKKAQLDVVYDIEIDSIIIEDNNIRIQTTCFRYFAIVNGNTVDQIKEGNRNNLYFLLENVDITDSLKDDLDELGIKVVDKDKDKNKKNNNYNYSNSNKEKNGDLKSQFDSLKALGDNKRDSYTSSSYSSENKSKINTGSFNGFASSSSSSSSNNSGYGSSISKPIGYNRNITTITKESAFSTSKPKLAVTTTPIEIDGLPSPILEKKKRYANSDELMIIYPVSKLDKDNKPIAQVRIIRSDMKRLDQEEFLNDSIIEFYIKYIKDNFLQEDIQDKFYFFNSFFYKKFTTKSNEQEAYKEIKKWTGNEDIFQKDFIFVPINQSQHWSLMILCFPGESLDIDNDKRIDYKRRPCMLYLDSLYKKPGIFAEKLRSYLTLEWMNKKFGNSTEEKRKYTKENYQLVIPHVPTQKNFSDCGVYLLHYIELFCKKPETNFKNPLENPGWFKNSEIIEKRNVIRSLIYRLRKEQDPKADSEEEENKFNILITGPKETPSSYADSSSLEIVSPIEDFKSKSPLKTDFLEDIEEDDDLDIKKPIAPKKSTNYNSINPKNNFDFPFEIPKKQNEIERLEKKKEKEITIQEKDKEEEDYDFLNRKKTNWEPEEEEEEEEQEEEKEKENNNHVSKYRLAGTSLIYTKPTNSLNGFDTLSLYPATTKTTLKPKENIKRVSSEKRMSPKSSSESSSESELSSSLSSSSESESEDEKSKKQTTTKQPITANNKRKPNLVEKTFNKKSKISPPPSNRTKTKTIVSDSEDDSETKKVGYKNNNNNDDLEDSIDQMFN